MVSEVRPAQRVNASSWLSVIFGTSHGWYSSEEVGQCPFPGSCRGYRSGRSISGKAVGLLRWRYPNVRTADEGNRSSEQAPGSAGQTRRSRGIGARLRIPTDLLEIYELPGHCPPSLERSRRVSHHHPPPHEKRQHALGDLIPPRDPSCPPLAPADPSPSFLGLVCPRTPARCTPSSSTAPGSRSTPLALRPRSASGACTRPPRASRPQGRSPSLPATAASTSPRRAPRAPSGCRASPGAQRSRRVSLLPARDAETARLPRCGGWLRVARSPLPRGERLLPVLRVLLDPRIPRRDRTLLCCPCPLGGCGSCACEKARAIVRLDHYRPGRATGAIKESPPGGFVAQGRCCLLRYAHAQCLRDSWGLGSRECAIVGSRVVRNAA